MVWSTAPADFLVAVEEAKTALSLRVERLTHPGQSHFKIVPTDGKDIYRYSRRV
jgi:hypothetical protein